MYDRKKSTPIYTECGWCGNGYRKTYLDGFTHLLQNRTKECQQMRDDFAKNLAVFREDKRKAFRNMLGWPLNVPSSAIGRVRTNDVGIHKGIQITRLQIEVFKEFWFYGILFVHKNCGHLPLVIVQHGGGGTPEMCSSFVDSDNYNDMTMRILSRGVNVFAPQLLLWYDQEKGPVPDRRQMDAELNLLGGSITALEITCIQRCMDYLSQQSFFNGTFAMAGLSYGGFYSMYTAAADIRISAVLNSCFFTDTSLVCWKDKAWTGAAATFLDAEVGGLICPRKLIIEVGDNDTIFNAQVAQKEYERLKTYYVEKPEQLFFHLFSGGHEFSPDSKSIDELISAIV